MFMRYLKLKSLAVALVGITSVSAEVGEPPETPKLELTLGKETANKLMQLCASVQTPGQNSWPLILEAISVLDEIHARFDPERLKNWHRSEIYFNGIFDEEFVKGDDRQVAVEALSMFRESRVAELLRRAGESPQFVVPLESNSEIGFQQWHKRIRNLAKAFVVSMRQAAIDHDSAQIIADAANAVVLARAASFQTDAISHLVGQSIATLVLGELCKCAGETVFDEQQCRSLMKIIESVRVAPFSVCLEGERIRFHRLIDWVFDERHSKDETQRALELAASGIDGRLMTLLAHDDEKPPENRIQFASRDEMHAEVDRLIDAQKAMLTKPMTEWRSAAESLKQDAAQIPEGQPIARAAVSVGVGYMKSAARYQAIYFDGTRLLLAIHAYKARHSRVPETINDLMPDFLTSIPLDVTTGKPFGYKRASDSQSAFTLYMYGVDGTDNGGFLKEGHDGRAFDEDLIGEGYDYIINHPRPKY